MKWMMCLLISLFSKMINARLYFDIASVTQFMEIILQDCILYLDWNEKRVALEQKTMTELIQDATVYYDKEFE